MRTIRPDAPPSSAPPAGGLGGRSRELSPSITGCFPTIVGIRTRKVLAGGPSARWEGNSNGKRLHRDRMQPRRRGSCAEKISHLFIFFNGGGSRVGGSGVAADPCLFLSRGDRRVRVCALAALSSCRGFAGSAYSACDCHYKPKGRSRRGGSCDWTDAVSGSSVISAGKPFDRSATAPVTEHCIGTGGPHRGFHF